MLLFAVQTQLNVDQIDGWLIDLANGDQTALDSLYLNTKSVVFGLALSILKNFNDAEDVLHDTFLSVYVNAPTYVAQGKPMSFILTIARNICLKKIRDGKRYGQIDEEQVEKFFVDRRLDVENIAENRLIIAECLNYLHDDEREILVMHAIGGVKFREIAKLLRIPLATALSKYNRAIKKLQKKFGSKEL